jgi:hypothetical protein
VGADCAGGHRFSVPLNDGQGVERSVGQTLTTCNRRDQRLGVASDHFEVSEYLGRQPGRARIFLLECSFLGCLGRAAPFQAPPRPPDEDGLSSSLHRDLDPRRILDPGAIHCLTQLVAAGESLRLLHGGEPVQDGHVILVDQVAQDLGIDAIRIAADCSKPGFSES